MNEDIKSVITRDIVLTISPDAFQAIVDTTAMTFIAKQRAQTAGDVTAALRFRDAFLLLSNEVIAPSIIQFEDEIKASDNEYLKKALTRSLRLKQRNEQYKRIDAMLSRLENGTPSIEEATKVLELTIRFARGEDISDDEF